jgi:hypothetical protein
VVQVAHVAATLPADGARLVVQVVTDKNSAVVPVANVAATVPAVVTKSAVQEAVVEAFVWMIP